MLFRLRCLIHRAQIAYIVRGGKVVHRIGDKSGRYVGDIESICKLHKAADGMIFGTWVGHDYRLRVTGALAKVKIPLNNCIN